jgi:DtxR family Mn-dependent transcriptional regulator
VQLQELSASVQDYLKVIAKTELAGGRATTSSVSAQLGVAPASVTNMMKKLAELDLVERVPYRGFVLTPTGRRLALEALRHHRLLEQFLVQRLGLSLEDAHEEADRLEHAISERLEERIDEELGFPDLDPHGDPIPDSALQVAVHEWRSLSAVGVGERTTVRRVPDADSAVPDYLARLGIVPGAHVEVVLAAPFGGPLTIRSRVGDHAISRELAAEIGVGEPYENARIVK